MGGGLAHFTRIVWIVLPDRLFLHNRSFHTPHGPEFDAFRNKGTNRFIFGVHEFNGRLDPTRIRTRSLISEASSFLHSKGASPALYGVSS
jgi:hypothetical protein